MDVDTRVPDELGDVLVTRLALVALSLAAVACGARADAVRVAETAEPTPTETVSEEPGHYCLEPTHAWQPRDGEPWVVPTDVTEVTAVEYDGMNADPCRTVTARIEAGEELSALVAELNALRPLPDYPPGSKTSCPYDDAREVTLTFSAPGGEMVVRVPGYGCRWATSPAGGPRKSNDELYAKLLALVAAHQVA